MQPTLPFESLRKSHLPPEGIKLNIPGSALLPDGRIITAELIETSPSVTPPQSATTVELDTKGMASDLCIRFGAPGDRFFPLGSPGSRRLTRFLADAGVPREERSRVPLVFAGAELVWVAGMRPCEPRKVCSHTTTRLRLTLSKSAR